MIKTVVKLYSEYIQKGTKEKLHSGKILSDSAKLLLDINSTTLDLNSKIERHYIMRKVADDLLSQIMNMGHSRQYDCVPELEDYTFLAFDLAYDYCDFRPDERLIPFLSGIIYYIKQSTEKKDLEKYMKLFRESVTKKKESFDRFITNNKEYL